METEAKFTVPTAAVFSRLSETKRLGPYRARKRRVREVQDRYVDTADRRFHQHGFAARLRTGEDGLLITLKRLDPAEGAVHSRDEYETPAPDRAITTWPAGAVRNLAEEIAGDRPLVDLVTLDQTRTVRILYEEARAVAEWSLDEVRFHGPKAPGRVYEMEMELLPDGTPADLAALIDLVAAPFGLVPQPQSKFERALALIAPAPPAGTKPPAGVRADDSLILAGSKVLRVQAAALEANEEGLRAGDDVRAIHKMRVATRRIRSALRLLEPYLAEPVDKHMRHGLRALSQALGSARDRDVLIAHAVEFRNGLPAEQQADLDGLLTDLEAAGRQARKEARQVLDSKEYAHFRKGLDAFLTAPDAPPDSTNGAQPYQVRHVAGGAIWVRYEAVRAYETIMAAPTVTQLHALRITGKYLRYALEFFREVLPGDTETLIADVVLMQDQLGALHDADVAAGLIRTYIGDQPAPPAGLVAYLVDRETAVAAIHADFARFWTTLAGPDWRARLAARIAAI